MLQISLEASQGRPLVEQIVDALRTRIDDRVLRAGVQLPPIRRFAEAHNVSRFTVVEAYDRLVALGYVQSRRGSGFYVAARMPPLVAEKSAAPPERAVDAAWMMRRALEDTDSPRVKAGAGWLPPSWLDEDGVLRNVRTLVRRTDLNITCYGHPHGYAPLRQQLQVRLAELGIAAQPGQIVLTQGATQALDLVARYLVKPGDCVFVDDPGYFNLFGNLRLHGAQLIGVPRGADGPDIATMEALLASHRPKVFYTQSALHNPTTNSLTPANAFRLLQLAEKHDFLIVEDDIFADFQPSPTTRLASLDQLRRVIYIGSFSKTLSANFRVGFLACDAGLAHDLVDIKLLSSISTSEFSERLAYLMLTEGHYRKYLGRLQGRLAKAMNATARLLERAGLQVAAEPREGHFLWARLPGPEDSGAIASRALDNDIVLAPGRIFRPQMQASPHLRFNVAYSADPRLERFLGEALG